MLDLPTPVLAYIHTLTIANYSPAYLLVKKDGGLYTWGGKLAKYGVTNLQKGEYVGKQVFFLEGLLPLEGSPIFLPCIKIDEGICADVHLFPGDEGDWVLLLDATLEAKQRSLIQQKGNDLSLLRQEQAGILNQYLGRDITENLGQKIHTLQVRGERRDVTILLANICGFTSYSKNNPPDIVFKTLNLYVSTMTQLILDEGGMVDKIVGDTVMAYFGILPSTESPPTQAIKAALRMFEAVRDIGEVWQVDNSSAFEIGIGVTSGPVTLGIVNNKKRQILSAIGYHVNLAMHLKSQAFLSEILIDENTFNRINSMQKYFAEITLLEQGMGEPVRIYSHVMK